jgi:hypothetical protein
VSRSSDSDRVYRFDELIAKLEDLERSLKRDTKTRNTYAVRLAPLAALAALGSKPYCEDCNRKNHVKENRWKHRRERKPKDMKGDSFSAEKTPEKPAEKMEVYTANTIEILLP